MRGKSRSSMDHGTRRARTPTWLGLCGVAQRDPGMDGRKHSQSSGHNDHLGRSCAGKSECICAEAIPAFPCRQSPRGKELLVCLPERTERLVVPNPPSGNITFGTYLTLQYHSFISIQAMLPLKSNPTLPSLRPIVASKLIFRGVLLTLHLGCCRRRLLPVTPLTYNKKESCWVDEFPGVPCQGQGMSHVAATRSHIAPPSRSVPDTPSQ